MRISKQFRVAMIFFGIVLAATSVSAVITNREVEAAHKQERIANGIVEGASELGYLANDYLIYGEEQLLERWRARFESYSTDVAGLQSYDPEHSILINNIEQNSENLENVFESVVNASDNTTEGQYTIIDQTMLQVSWSRLAVQSQGLVSDASQLAVLYEERGDELHRMNSMFIFTLIGAFAAFLLVNFALFQRRTLSSIAKLQEGTRSVGSGNLDIIVEEKRNDEIGELSRAFNRMVGDLKRVTTSKKTLEEEINKRNELEEELRISNENLQEQANRLGEEVEERKKTEDALSESREQLRIALESAKLGTFDYSTLTNELEWDEQTRRIYGISMEGRIDFEDSIKAIHPDDRERVRATITRALDPVYGGHYFAEYRIVRPDGSIRWNQAMGRVYFKGYGAKRRAVRLVGANYDITDRKKTDQVKDDFIGMVSHELKTPITVVKGAILTAIDDRISEEERRELLIDAAWGVESLDGILNNLLELSRYQSGRLTLNKKPVDIKDIAAGVITALRKQYPKRAISLIIPEELPKALVDPIRLERILFNLVDNACKYSSEEAEVKISAKRVKNNIVVSVSDRGKGIAYENQKAIFEPFSRLDSSKSKGIGLGLVVCKRLVEAHDGRIWVESVPGEGSKFLFTIPL